MNAVQSPLTSSLRTHATRPTLLVVLALVLIGGATGSLIGPFGVVVFAVVGLAWGLLLTTAVGWLLGSRPSRRRWATALIAGCFVPIALLASSLPQDPILRLAIAIVIVAIGAGLTVAATWLSRSRPVADAWTTATLYAAVMVGGLLSGSGLLGQLLMNAALADAPPVFATLVRGPVGDAEAMPFYLINPPMELLLIPLVALLTWQMPHRRRLILPALVIFVFTRVWTYLYFVPQIASWGAAPHP